METVWFLMMHSTVAAMSAQDSVAQFAAVVSQLRRGEALDKLTPLARRQGLLTEDEARADQRWRLLGAMAFVVAARGYWPATIAEIAETANVSKKTFYQHFSSKEEAFLAAYDIIDVVIVQIRGAMGLFTVEALASTLIRRYLYMVERSPEYAQMMLFQPLATTPAIRARRIAGWGRYVTAIQDVLDQGRQAGVAVAELSDMEIMAMLGGINELCIQHISVHGVSGIEEALAQPLEVFVQRILRP